MNRAAVLIGVNKVNGLPTLNDAARGAQRMHAWALEQGFAPNHTKLITDEETPVTLSKIGDAINQLLEPAAGIEQLIIYFAGHGLNINYGEFWLLSGGFQWPAESVDVARSVVLARHSSVPHVIIISDACRTAAVGIQQQFITGAPIFPIVTGGGTEQAVDQFFACTLGNPALEIQNQSAANAGTFVALYTDELLGILNGSEPEIIESANDGKMPPSVIRPWPLKRVLQESINRTLIELGLHTKIFQTPDARISSDPQLAWVSRLNFNPNTAPKIPPKNRNLENFGTKKRNFNQAHFKKTAPSLPSWVDTTIKRIITQDSPSIHPKNPPGAKEIDLQASEISMQLKSLDFENYDGIKLRGKKVVETIFPSSRTRRNRGIESLKEYPQKKPDIDRVLLIFNDGSGAIIPLLPNFIANLIFYHDRWVSLSYEPAEKNLLFKPSNFEYFQQIYLRELIGTAFERGVFQPDHTTLTELIEYILKSPIPDPVLLLYIAYALHDAGMLVQLRSLSDELQATRFPLLCDVELLYRRQHQKPKELGDYFPIIPLLSRGWPNLIACEANISEDLDKISRMRYPSMWSHFTADAIRIIRKKII